MTMTFNGKGIDMGKYNDNNDSDRNNVSGNENEY